MGEFETHERLCPRKTKSARVKLMEQNTFHLQT